MTANERLRDALSKRGMRSQQLAERVGVDVKTVERWITSGRAPYPKHRRAVASELQETETFLWPDAVPAQRQLAISQSEVVTTYPRRSSVPSELWTNLLRDATEHIGILAYAGLFLPEHDPNLIPMLKKKAQEGTTITILLGDPEGDAVARRGEEEGIGAAMAAKITNVLSFYHQLQDSGVFVGFHSTTLYNSIYRYDDEMLVNTHVFGFPAAHAPVQHLRKITGGSIFDTYADSFDRVWSSSKNIWGGSRGKVRPWTGE